MNDKKIIEMFEKGLSINYIATKYHNFINIKKKPIVIDSIYISPPKFDLEYCKRYVCSVIIQHLIQCYR